jgi:hypothetical protein
MTWAFLTNSAILGHFSLHLGYLFIRFLGFFFFFLFLNVKFLLNFTLFRDNIGLQML